MKQDNFEQELKELYQQRKAHLQPPQIKLSASSERSNGSLIKYLSIFMMGGLASFSIMALVNYLSHSNIPTQKPLQLTKQYQVEVDQPVVTEKSDIVTEKLPVKPSLKLTPAANLAELEKPEPTLVTTSIEVEKLSVDENVVVPQVKQVEQIPKLVYKRMPTYRFSYSEKQTGFVRLSYKIATSGKVDDVQIVDSDLGSGIQKAAKKALNQWKYQSGSHSQISHEIIFEFNNNS